MDHAENTTAGSAQAAQQLVYPLPEATQEQVIRDREVFDRALKRLHTYFSITDRPPRVGGRELDLFQLYCNVTALGGCAEVIANKLWREAAESFNYPDTITSVSFTLRKVYSQLLWDFEQIYFSQKTGLRQIPPGSHTAANANSSANGTTPGENGNAGCKTAIAKGSSKKRKSEDLEAHSLPQLPAGSPLHMTAACRGAGSPDAHAVGAKGSVTLDARFDAGYFVTVHVGSQEFKGMLYYPPSEPVEALVSGPSRLQSAGANGVACADEAKGRKGAARARDPNAPKVNRTPFNFFSVEARAKAKASFPDLSQSEISKKVGEMWQKAGQQERTPYVAMAAADKDRYLGELEAHNYRLAAQAAQQQAHAAAQQVASLSSGHLPDVQLPGSSSGNSMQQLPGTAVQLPSGFPEQQQLPLGSPQLSSSFPCQQLAVPGLQLPANGQLPSVQHQQQQHAPFMQQPAPSQQQILLQSMPPQIAPLPLVNLPSIIDGWRPSSS